MILLSSLLDHEYIDCELLNLSFEKNLSSIQIHNIAMDSREVLPGTLFICCSGARENGHNFIEDAISAGAAAVIITQTDRLLSTYFEHIPIFKSQDARKSYALLSAIFFDFPARNMQIIGVTGTDGKSTVTYLLEAILCGYGVPVAALGSVGLYRSASLRHTTLRKIKTGLFHKVLLPYMTFFRQVLVNVFPRYLKRFLSEVSKPRDAFRLQRYLRALSNEGVTSLILETTSHALDQDRVAGIDFAVAVWTNLTEEHQDYHGSMDDYFRAKAKLFQNLTGSGKQIKPIAVINRDDPYADLFTHIARQRHADIWTYGVAMDATIVGSELMQSLAGIQFMCQANGERFPVQSLLNGEIGMRNALAAIAAALALNIPVPIIQKAVAQFPKVPGRFEIVSRHDPVVVVDFAHTPNGLMEVLKTARLIIPAANKIWLVCAANIAFDAAKRLRMGEVAGEYADCIHITGNGYASENLETMMSNIASGVGRRTNTVPTMIPDRRQAIHDAIQRAQPDDLVMITGRGSDTVLKEGATLSRFDDRIVAREALKKRSSCQR